MARYLFFSINNVWAYHFETEMELMYELLQQGHEVFVLGCNGILDACSSNSEHVKSGCLKCISRRNNGLKKIGIKPSSIITLQSKNVDFSLIPKKFDSQAALENFELDGINLGRWVVSIIMTDIREHIVDMNEHTFAIHKRLRASYLIAKNLLSIIPFLKIEGVYLHNGRFFDYAPVVEVCRKLGTDFFVHARGGSLNRYALMKNHLPHELEPIKHTMKDLWFLADASLKKDEAAAWFNGVRNASKKVWMSPIHIAGQRRGSLPSNWDAAKRNIAIFNGSLFEFGIFSEWRNSPGFFQNNIIEKIAQYFAKNTEIHFYLRIHPNLKGPENSQIREIREIISRIGTNLTVLWPEDPVDTYALIEGSEKVLTFGSTVGVEACYWGKPSILWGRAFYEDLDCVEKPTSFEELCNLIKDVSLKARPQEKALPYGFWCLNKGQPFKHYKQTSLYEGAFQGEVIKPTLSILDKLQLKIDAKKQRIFSRFIRRA